MIYIRQTATFIADRGRHANLVYGTPSSSNSLMSPIVVTYMGPPNLMRTARDKREVVVDLWGCKMSDQMFESIPEAVRSQMADHVDKGYITISKAGVNLKPNQVLTADFRVPIVWLNETIPIWVAPPATKTYQGDFVAAHNATPVAEDPISENMGPEMLRGMTIQVSSLTNCTVTLLGTALPYRNTGDLSWPYETIGSDMPGIGDVGWIDVTLALTGAATIVADSLFDLSNVPDGLMRLHNFRIRRVYNVPGAGGTCIITVLV